MNTRETDRQRNRAKAQRSRQNLCDSYVRKLLLASGVPVETITPVDILAKREELTEKRNARQRRLEEISATTPDPKAYRKAYLSAYAKQGHVKEHQKRYYKHRIDTLKEPYLRVLLGMESPTPELIEVKRQQLEIKRLTKQLKKEIENVATQRDHSHVR